MEEGISYAHKHYIWNNEEDVEAIVETLNTNKNLQYINLEDNSLGVSAAAAIGKALAQHGELREVIWSKLFMFRLNAEISEALTHLSSGLMAAEARLTVLNLSDNALGLKGLNSISRLLRSTFLHALKELNLSNCELGVEGARKLSDDLYECFQNSKSKDLHFCLNVLKIDRNRIEDEGARALSITLSILKTLEYISVKQNAICYEGMSALATAFKDNTKLKTLDISENTITENGAWVIGDALEYMPELRELYMGDCLIQSAGAFYIAESLLMQNDDLEILNLEFNDIGNKAGLALVDVLAQKPYLSYLNINGNKFSSETRKKIKYRMLHNDTITVLQSLNDNESMDSSDTSEDYAAKINDEAFNVHEKKFEYDIKLPVEINDEQQLNGNNLTENIKQEALYDDENTNFMAASNDIDVAEYIVQQKTDVDDIDNEEVQQNIKLEVIENGNEGFERKLIIDCTGRYALANVNDNIESNCNLHEPVWDDIENWDDDISNISFYKESDAEEIFNFELSTNKDYEKTAYITARDEVTQLNASNILIDSAVTNKNINKISHELSQAEIALNSQSLLTEEMLKKNFPDSDTDTDNDDICLQISEKVIKKTLIKLLNPDIIESFIIQSYTPVDKSNILPNVTREIIYKFPGAVTEEVVTDTLLFNTSNNIKKLAKEIIKFFLDVGYDNEMDEIDEMELKSYITKIFRLITVNTTSELLLYNFHKDKMLEKQIEINALKIFKILTDDMLKEFLPMISNDKMAQETAQRNLSNIFENLAREMIKDYLFPFLHRDKMSQEQPQTYKSNISKNNGESFKDFSVDEGITVDMVDNWTQYKTQNSTKEMLNEVLYSNTDKKQNKMSEEQSYTASIAVVSKFIKNLTAEILKVFSFEYTCKYILKAGESQDFSIDWEYFDISADSSEEMIEERPISNAEVYKNEINQDVVQSNGSKVFENLNGETSENFQICKDPSEFTQDVAQSSTSNIFEKSTAEILNQYFFNNIDKDEINQAEMPNLSDELIKEAVVKNIDAKDEIDTLSVSYKSEDLTREKCNELLRQDIDKNRNGITQDSAQTNMSKVIENLTEQMVQELFITDINTVDNEIVQQNIQTNMSTTTEELTKNMINTMTNENETETDLFNTLIDFKALMMNEIPDDLSESSVNDSDEDSTDNFRIDLTKVNSLEFFCLSPDPCTMENFEAMLKEKETLLHFVNQFRGANYFNMINFCILKCAHLAKCNELALENAILLLKECYARAAKKNMTMSVTEFFLQHLGCIKVENFKPIFDKESCRYTFKEALTREGIIHSIAVVILNKFIQS